MKVLIEAAILSFGFVMINCSIPSSGSYIRELSTLRDVNNYNRETGKFKLFLHLFSLNQSSEYLVKNVATNKLAMYKYEEELPVDMSGHWIWQKIGLKGD